MSARKGLHKGEILITKETSIWKILETLAHKGPLNVKGIAKNIRLDYAYCHKRVKILLKTGLIEFKEKRKGQKGKDLSFYDLSLIGLCHYLKTVDFKNLDKAAGKYRDYLPHVFGEWQYFKDSGLEPVIFRNLTKSMSVVTDRLTIFKKIISATGLSLQEEIEEGTLAPWITGVHLGFWQENVWNAELHKALRQNSNLWSYMQPRVTQLVNKTRELLNRLNMILK